jgi:hypothetical protein
MCDYEDGILEQMGDDGDERYDEFGGSLEVDEPDDRTEEELEALEDSEAWASMIADAEEEHAEEYAARIKAWGPVVRSVAATLGLTMADDAVENFLSSCRTYELTKGSPMSWVMKWEGKDVDMKIDHRDGVDEKLLGIIPTFSAFFNATEWALINAQES